MKTYKYNDIDLLLDKLKSINRQNYEERLSRTQILIEINFTDNENLYGEQYYNQAGCDIRVAR